GRGREVGVWRKGLWTRLCLPGCLSVSGPPAVTGTEGGSLSVRCRYEEKFINNNKYWVKTPCFLSGKIVETAESEREVRDGRVSIRDHPANLTFTVTLERLTEDDAGTYCCGIDEALALDPAFQLEVAVIPGEPRAPPLAPAPGSPKDSLVRGTKSSPSRTRGKAPSPPCPGGGPPSPGHVVLLGSEVLSALAPFAPRLKAGLQLLAWVLGATTLDRPWARREGSRGAAGGGWGGRKVIFNRDDTILPDAC
uniref:Ig-like domain-containing protein n=1 Tax=Catagonus wagneri TaxID=51154 RepID=A0A8C3WMN4_9CETA